MLSRMASYRCSWLECHSASVNQRERGSIFRKALPVEMGILRDKELEIQETRVDKFLRDVY
jgi:hypothetical protein